MDLSNYSILKIEKERTALDSVVQEGNKAKTRKDQLEIVRDLILELGSFKRKAKLFPENEQVKRRVKFIELWPLLSLHYCFRPSAYNKPSVGSLLSHIDRFPNVEKHFLAQGNEEERGLIPSRKKDLENLVKGLEKDKDEPSVEVRKKETLNRELSEKEMSRIEI